MGAQEKIDGSRGFKSNKAAKLKKENGFKSATVTEYERLINSLYSVLPTLTHHQIKLVKKIVHKQFFKEVRKEPASQIRQPQQRLHRTGGTDILQDDRQPETSTALFLSSAAWPKSRRSGKIQYTR